MKRGISRAERHAIFVKAIEDGKTIRDAGREIGIKASQASAYYAKLKANDFAPLVTDNLPPDAPADFVELATTMTKGQLARHYDKHHKAITRWLRETGSTCLPYVPPVAKPKPEPKRAGPAVNRSVAGPIKLSGIPQGDISMAGEAAHFLRRTIVPVYRADVLDESARRKLPNNGRDMFVVGRIGAIPAADVIAMAEKRGFRATSY